MNVVVSLSFEEGDDPSAEVILTFANGYQAALSHEHSQTVVGLECFAVNELHESDE
jgi:hypothetical protein